ncbi:MAG: dTDP-4-dehydrorhamnose 3,5-epimerase family protein [Cyanobacteria bacterium P01_D01_bin.6]
MKFIKTPLAGAFLVELPQHSDHRGFFSRFFCADTFKAQGLDYNMVQCNISRCNYRGTLRGLHYQTAPALESKFIRCTRGEICDVLVDMRPESPSYLQHYTVILSADSNQGMYIPGMCAHGYQALQDDTEVMYLTSCPYDGAYEKGLRYDDPHIGMQLPIAVTEISDKDKSWPNITP